MDENLIFKALIVVGTMVLSLAVHEWAHAFAAFKLGDDTAAQQGRMTLSPEKHIDIIGSLVFPALSVFWGGMLLGWAKPVPYVPTRFTRRISMKKGTLIVAIAGPLSNLILALLCAIALKGMLMYGGTEMFLDGWGKPIGQFLGAGFNLNLVLFVFNFIPVPPLDGSKILYGLLPHRYDGIIEFLERYSLWIFIGVLFFGMTFIATYIMSPLFVLIVTLMGLEGVAHLMTF